MTAITITIVTVAAILIMRILTKRDDGMIKLMSATYSLTTTQKLLPIVKLSMAVLISLVVIALSVYIILCGDCGEDEKHFAYGSIGTVLGYWLKNESGI